jgi:tetratricopeptide (TPR) repeat protein
MSYRCSNDLPLAESGLDLLKGDYAEAARHLEEARRARPDAPIVYRRQAYVFYQLRQYDESAAAGDEYLRMLGPDQAVLSQTAMAYEAGGRREEAAMRYRRLLDRWPADAEAFAGLARVLPKGGRAELGERLGRAPDPQVAFDRATMSVLIDGELDAAADLAEAFRRLRPDAPGGWSKAAVVEIRRGNPGEAARFLADAVRKTTGRSAREQVLSGFLHAAVSAKQVTAAYTAAAGIDRRFAFRTLADRLCDDLDDDEEGDVEEPAVALDAVLTEHRKADPDDPWLDFVSGRLHERGKRYEEADRKFAAVAARLPAPWVGPPVPETFPRDDHEMLRVSRTHCWFRLGKGLAAYHEFGGRERFSQLAHLYENESDVDGLERLVAAHEKRDPDDPDVLYFRAGAHWLAKRYEEAVAGYRAYREKAHKVAAREEDFPLPFDWVVRDRIVRGLIRLGKPTEAKRALEEMPTKWSGVLPVLVAAASGDVAETAAAMKKAVGDRGRPDWLYGDSDLGPLLKGEKFRPLRDQFPPPAEEKPAGPKR